MFGSGEARGEYGRYPERVGEVRFMRQGYRDVFFAFLFIVQLAGLGVVLYFSVTTKFEGEEEKDPVLINSSLSGSEIRKLILVWAGSTVASVLLAGVYISIILYKPIGLIYFSLSFSVFFSFSISIFSLLYGQPFAALSFFLFGMLQAFLYLAWRPRIPFASAILSTVSSLISLFPAMLVVSFVFTVIQLLFLFLWTHTLLYSQRLENIFLFIFLIFSLFWTSQVIRNTIHVTNAGVYATWYFLYPSPQQTGEASALSTFPALVKNPTLASLKRALTTSFGSICLGSLIVALIQTLRSILAALVRSRNNDNNLLVSFLAACGDCILWCLDSLLQYFNIYAFTQVAIYGKSYIEAARSTWRLIDTHGLWAVINDNILGAVIMVGTLSGALLSAITGGFLSYFLINEYWVAMAIIAGITGYLILSVVMELVESGSAATFVCFAEDPLALQRNNPMLYTLFYDTYGQSIFLV